MWITEFDDRSYRSIFKWGGRRVFKHPDKSMLEFIRKTFGLTNEDIQNPHLPGLETVRLDAPPKLKDEELSELKKIVGEENVATDDYDRAKHAYGKTYLDLVRLRKAEVPEPPDAVAYPRDEADVEAVVRFCDKGGIALVPAGGMSSVTRGIEFPKGGICLDLTRHMNKVLELNEADSTARVQPGMYGPAYEKRLNSARSKAAPQGFTGGHFPQSFEYSTVGGWIAARGAGQQSTGYGKIEDIVLAMRWITPAGPLVTSPYPAAAIGPDIDRFMVGSEGVFGVLTEATLKIRKNAPDDRKFFCFMFRSWRDAVDACREIMQGGFGFPSAMRVSDPEETMVGLKLHNFEGTLIDTGMSALGYRSAKRCLMMGATEGDADAGGLIKSKIKKIAGRHGALSLGKRPVKAWWKGRYSDPYMREDLMDIGVMTDTLETAVNWSNLMRVWEGVREVVKSRPNTVCLVHASHFYENGANLYFIFLSKMVKGDEVDDYLAYQRDIVDAIRGNGGSLSHHHCVGRMLAPWMRNQVGAVGLDMMRAVKKQLDPNNIMNPGGTLGLDYEGEIR